MENGLTSLFNELGHVVIGQWSITHIGSGRQEFVLVLTKFNAEFKGQIAENQLISDEEGINGLATEYLLHQVLLKDMDRTKIKSTKYFEVTALISIDANDDNVNEEECTLSLGFGVNPSSQTKKLDISFNSIEEKYSFLSVLLQIKVKILESIPEVLNLNQAKFIAASASAAEIRAMNQNSSEVIPTSSPKGRMKEFELSEEPIFPLESATRGEDEELDELILKEKLQRIHFSELEEKLDSLIAEEELKLIKSVVDLEDKGQHIFERKITNSMKTVLEESNQVYQNIKNEMSLFDECKEDRRYIFQATERTSTWLINVDKLESELDDLLKNNSLSETSESTFGRLNQLLSDISNQLKDKSFSIVKGRKLEKELTLVRELMLDVNFALKGKNNFEDSSKKSLKNRSEMHLRDNMVFIAQQKEELEMTKLAVATNVQFVLLDLINHFTQQMNEKISSMNLEDIQSVTWLDFIDRHLHTKLLYFADLVKLLPTAEFDHLKDTYKVELTKVYEALLSNSFRILLNGQSSKVGEILKLELQGCASLPLADSPEGSEAIEQQYYSNIQIWTDKDTSTNIFYQAFVELISLFLDLVQAEASFSPSFFFYYESNIQSNDRNSTNKTRVQFGQRRVKFDSDERAQETVEQQGDMFFEADAFLFDLFSSKFDILQKLDEKLWELISKNNLHYTTTLMITWLEGKLSQRKKSRSFGGSEYISFVKKELEKLVTSWMKQYLDSQLKLLQKAINQNKGSTAAEWFFKIPDFLHKLICIPTKKSKFWLEKSVSSFLISVLNLLRGQGKPVVCDICYFLKHSIAAMISHKETSISKIFEENINDILSSFTSLYDENLKRMTAKLLLKYFQFLVDFNKDANMILTTCLSTSHHKELMYHIPFERFKSVVQLLTANELDIQVVERKKKMCLACVPPKQSNLLDSLKKLHVDIESNSNVLLRETREILKEKLIVLLVENYRAFRNIASTCYQQHVQMPTEKFEEIARRYLETTI